MIEENTSICYHDFKSIYPDISPKENTCAEDNKIIAIVLRGLSERRKIIRDQMDEHLTSLQPRQNYLKKNKVQARGFPICEY